MPVADTNASGSDSQNPTRWWRLAVVAGERMAADEPRADATACQAGVHRRDDRFLGAANVGNERRGGAHGRRLYHAFRDGVDWCGNDDQLRLGDSVREIRDAMVDGSHRASRL